MDKNYAALPYANDFNVYVKAAPDNNEISKDERYELKKVYFTKLYLSQDNLREQSGHGTTNILMPFRIYRLWTFP